MATPALEAVVVSSSRRASRVGMEGRGGLAAIGGELRLLALVVILITGTTGQNNDDGFVDHLWCCN